MHKTVREKAWYALFCFWGKGNKGLAPILVRWKAVAPQGSDYL